MHRPRSDRDGQVRQAQHRVPLLRSVLYLEGLLEGLGLRYITLVVGDWGSALGFHYASRNQANVKAMAFMEAILMPVPSWDAFPAEAAQQFKAFRAPGEGWGLIVDENLFIEKVLPAGVVRQLSDREVAAYREPFTDPAGRKVIWRWPSEIPIGGEPPDVTVAVQAYNRWLQHRPGLPRSAGPHIPRGRG